MNLKDEIDYVKEDRADLVSRLLTHQMFSQFFLRAYDAFRNYGVDFKKLPEWLDQSDLDKARKLKPNRAQELIVGYLTRLNNGLTAAIRRKQFRLLNPSAPKETTDDA